MLALLAALLFRLYPLAAGGEVLDRFFITEDGYLLLTVARNLALGNGLSVSAGEIASNGFQPLATFLFAIPYLITDGDKWTGLWGVGLASALVCVFGCWLVWRFALRAFGGQVNAVLALIVAALWFSGPLLMFHSMNGLETALYTAMIVATLVYMGHLLATRTRLTWGDRILLGTLCGLVFLARNDGVFLVVALLGIRFMQAQMQDGLSLGEALAEVVPAGLVALAWAAPWLIYNLSISDSIIPISGQAQSLKAVFAGNLDQSPVKAFETMFPMLPLPRAIERMAYMDLITGAIAALILVVFVWRVLRAGGTFRWVILAYAIYAVAIFCYYSLAFGASHFLSRYFAPSAPLLITAAVSVGYALLIAVLRHWARPALLSVGLLSVLLCLALLARTLQPGANVQGHFQVVDWVRANVAEETWAGAVQTGTLGYWHDRTINLDGKVNPDALAARKADGHIFAYAVESRIEVIADWTGIAHWAAAPEGGFSQRFELIVNDEANNLAVLRRRR